MILHHLTVNAPTSVTHVAAGNFFSAKTQDFAVVKGSQDVEVLSQNLRNGLLETVLVLPTFSQVRAVAAYRPVGFDKDFLAVTSDSGNLSIIEFLDDHGKGREADGGSHPSHVTPKTFRVVVQEALSRSGCRRVSPGTYIAKDPKGRAILLGALERTKVVYLTTKNGETGGISLSSPLEANTPLTLTYDVVGLDNEYNNPTFVALETEYPELDIREGNPTPKETGKMLSVYEVDLGLNQVVRKKTLPVSKDARCLVALPHGKAATASFLVVYDDRIECRSIAGDVVETLSFPIRIDNYRQTRRYQIVAHTTYRLQDTFEVFLANEVGDLFRVAMDGGRWRTEYLCTEAVPTCMAVLKTRYMFKANENADHTFLEVRERGDDDQPVRHSHVGEYYVPVLPCEVSTKDTPPTPDVRVLANPSTADSHHEHVRLPGRFQGLRVVQRLSNLAGITDSKCADLVGEGRNQLYTLQGGVNGASLKRLRASLNAEQLSDAATKMGTRRLFAVRSLSTAQDDSPNAPESRTKYLLMSSDTRTHVSSVGTKMELVRDELGFVLESETVHFFELEDHRGTSSRVVGWVQVAGHEVRVIRGPNSVRRTANRPGTRTRMAKHHRDRIVTVTDGKELEFWHLNTVTREFESESVANLGAEPTAVAFFGGDVRGEPLMVALAFPDRTVKIFSPDAKNSMTRLSLIKVEAPVTCLEFSRNHLLIGVHGGDLMRVYVDPATGALGDSSTFALAHQRLSIFRNLPLGTGEGLAPRRPGHGDAGMVISGDQNYFVDEEEGFLRLTPIGFGETGRIASMAYIDNPEELGHGCVIYVTEEGVLKVSRVSGQGRGFHPSGSLNLSYTGRRLLINRENLSLVVVMSQNRVLDAATLESELHDLNAHTKTSLGWVVDFAAEQRHLLHFHPSATHWVSALAVVSPKTLQTHSELVLPGNNKHILAAQLTTFKAAENRLFLVASVVEDHDILRNVFRNSQIVTYEFDEGFKRLTPLHATRLEEMCTELSPFRGRLLAGCGGFVRLYDLGTRQLLKKSEYKHRFGFINGIRSTGRRVWVSDAADSVHLLRFEDDTAQFDEMADDVLPRYTTCFEQLDYNTVAAADKFGNVYVLRLAQGTEDETGKDLAAYQLRGETGYLSGAPAKFDLVCSFYDVNAVTSLHNASNPRNRRDYLIGTNVEGKVFVFAPFENRPDVDFFRHFELLMRMDDDPELFPTGRTHLLYRGYHAAVKDVTDGDLTETYFRAPPGRRKAVTDGLERSDADVARRLEEMRFSLV